VLACNLAGLHADAWILRIHSIFSRTVENPERLLAGNYRWQRQEVLLAQYTYLSCRPLCGLLDLQFRGPIGGQQATVRRDVVLKPAECRDRDARLGEGLRGAGRILCRVEGHDH
jgi:hypothetical protein